MPRNVRNFWIDLDVDGRSNSIETGPRSKDGTFNMTIKIRDAGSVSVKTVDINGYVDNDALTVLAHIKSRGTIKRTVKLLQTLR